MTSQATETSSATRANPSPLHTFKVGDAVHWAAGSDTDTGHVVRITPTRVYVVEAECKLLNGASSGEEDALDFSPGGFCGHTSGKQRWDIQPGDGEPLVFTLRKTGYFKQSGASTRGSMTTWGNLKPGARRHYDFNF